MRVRPLLLGMAMLTASYGQNRNPIDIPAGCVVWLAADDVTAPDGSRVSVWPGRCGGASARSNAQDLSPAFRANMINGHPAVRFDGVRQFMRLPQIHRLATIYAVVRIQAGSIYANRGVLGTGPFYFKASNNSGSAEVTWETDAGKATAEQWGAPLNVFELMSGAVDASRGKISVSVSLNGAEAAGNAPLTAL